jgi:Domain of unknown function (DUF4139)
VVDVLSSVAREQLVKAQAPRDTLRLRRWGRVFRPAAEASAAANAGWQRNLSVSYNKIGDVLVAQGNLPEARSSAPSSEGSAGLITTSKTDQRDYKIAVRNGHNAAVRVAIEDQLPVSEIEDVKVELLPGSTAPTERDVRNRRGVVAWSFELGAREARDIKFGWRVRWPSDKSVVYTPGL